MPLVPRIYVGTPAQNSSFFNAGIWTNIETPNGISRLPRIGETVFVWATIHNHADLDFTDVRVNFYFHPVTAAPGRAGAIKIGLSYLSIQQGEVRDVLCISPWGVRDTGCLIVELEHALIPASQSKYFEAIEVPWVGQRNLDIVSAQDGSIHRFPFTVGPYEEGQEIILIASRYAREELAPICMKSGLDVADFPYILDFDCWIECNDAHAATTPSMLIHVYLPANQQSSPCLCVAVRNIGGPGSIAGVGVEQKNADRTVGGFAKLLVP
jgi:hypothetical protein